jgi:hypothetical protein
VNNSDRPDHQQDEEFRIDVLGTLERRGRTILIVSGALALIAAVVMGIQYLRQPVTRIASVEFRPTFAGAPEGQYPNGLSFAVTDITAPSIVESVYDRNGIVAYCGRDGFKGGLFVEQQSADYAFLEAEFQSRLATPQLTPMERERLQTEYRTRRSAIPLQYRLVFAAIGGCNDIPETLLAKALTEVLSEWAEQSEVRRGVLKLQVAVVTPSVLDIDLPSDGSRLVRADLIRSALNHVITNIREVEALPGAVLVRAGDKRVALAEIRARLEGLVQARLEPLVVMAGRGLGQASRAWVQEALASAVNDRNVAEGKVESYLRALRVYDGARAQVSAAAASPEGSAGDARVQTQIDGGLIDRVLQMSEPNLAFKQDLTRKMVEADGAAAGSRARVAYYSHVLSALEGRGGTSLTQVDVDRELTAIVDDAKALVGQFNLLYEEWSAVALRPASAMYRVDASVRDETIHGGRLILVPLVAIAAFFVSLLIVLVFFVARDHYAEWRLRRAPRARG